MSRSERIAKYNRLLEIEIELTASNSVFYGLNSLFSLDFNNTQLFKVASPAPEKVEIHASRVAEAKSDDDVQPPKAEALEIEDPAIEIVSSAVEPDAEPESEGGDK